MTEKPIYTCKLCKHPFHPEEGHTGIDGDTMRTHLWEVHFYELFEHTGRKTK